MPFTSSPRLRAAALGALALATALSPAAAASPLCYRGVNLSGAEYGARGGKLGTDYIYPSTKTIGYFASQGMNAIRLPFRWERIQPALNGPLDKGELKHLHQAVRDIRKSGMTAILDPHNFAQYDKKSIGTGDVSPEAFADLWARLAAEFSGDEGVVFGLMNEPFDMTAPDWLTAANMAIAAIRKKGATNLVLVPGTLWSGAHSWTKPLKGGSNGKVMAGVRDPGNNFAFELHQYQDADYSGTKGECSRAADARQAIADVSTWLRKHKARGFLGEFGGTKDEGCLAGLKGMVEQVSADSDVWIGWAYWAAGEWWPEAEALNIQPRGKGTPPQLQALLPALQSGPADPDLCAPKP